MDFVFALIRSVVYSIFLLLPFSELKVTIVAYFMIYVYQLVRLTKIDINYKKKYSIVNFNVLFFIMYTLCTFTIPFFHLIGFNDYGIFIPIRFDIQYLPKALFFSSVAVECYMWGYIRGLRKKLKTINYYSPSSIRNAKFITEILSFPILVLFYFGFNTARSAGIMDVSGQLLTLATTVAILPLLFAGYANRYYHYSLAVFIVKNIIPFTIILLIVIGMLSLGDRLVAICMLSAAVFIINEFVYKIRVREFIISIAGGFLLMVSVSYTRSLSVSEGLNMINSNEERFSTLQDVYPANAVFLLGTEAVDKQGYYKPLRIIPYALSPVPFLPGWIKMNFFDGEIGSAKYLTVLNRARTNIGDSGTGTHVVVDVYVSWGIIGIVLLFSLFGYFVGMCYSRREDMFYLLAYTSLISWAVFIPRESLFDPYRNAIWLVVIAYLIIGGKAKKTLLNNNK